MNLPSQHNAEPDSIAVFVEIPGLQLSGVAGVLFSLMFKRSLRAALDEQGLIAVSPANAESRQLISDATKAIGGLLQKIRDAQSNLGKLSRATGTPIAASGASLPVEAIAVMVREYVLEMSECASCTSLAAENWLYALVNPSDTARALVVVKATLEKLSLLPFSEIATFDENEHLCRTFYPESCALPFERHLPRVANAIADASKRLPGGST